MTVQEIKDLIASKIAGQGSAVDAGSALPEILNGIIDAIEENKPEDEFTLVSPFGLGDDSIVERIQKIQDESTFLQCFPNGNILLSGLKQANNRDFKVKEVVFDSEISTKLRLACILNEVGGNDRDEDWHGTFNFGGLNINGDGAELNLSILWNRTEEAWEISATCTYV